MKKLILFLFLSSLAFAQRPYTIRTAYLPEVDYAAILFQPVVIVAGRLQSASGTLSGSCSPNGSIRYDGAHTAKLCVNGTYATLTTGSSGANTALSNLASVSINASLIPQTTLNLGAQATPWKEIWFYGSGTFASHSFKLTGTPTGHRVITFTDASGTVAYLESPSFTTPVLGVANTTSLGFSGTAATSFGFSASGSNLVYRVITGNHHYLQDSGGSTMLDLTLASAVFGGTLQWNSGTAISKHLSATATLDFANLAAIGCEDLTITVTGAAVGDTVSLGVPNASIVTNGTFFAWVSATNTVSVKFCTVVSGDPASGTFRADVTQH